MSGPLASVVVPAHDEAAVVDRYLGALLADAAPGELGSAVYAVLEAGHRRIAPFPDVVVNDDYVRRSFAPHERATTEGAHQVRLLRTVAGYVHRALRGRAGNVALAASGIPLAPQPTPSGVLALLPLLRDARMWAPVASFVALTTLVRVRLALAGGSVAGWNHDLSSRAGATS